MLTNSYPACSRGTSNVGDHLTPGNTRASSSQLSPWRQLKTAEATPCRILNLAEADDRRGPVSSRVGAATAGAYTGSRQVTAGSEYALSRRTSLHAYGAWLRNDDRGREPDCGLLRVSKEAALRTVALGMRTSF